jgi:aminoglycoside phosphotransferase (APT) family kinase protein
MLRTDGAIDDPAPFLDFLERVAPRSDEAAPHVVHGDLYARHVLVGEDGALAGVIDWGDLHAGDPALDLAVGDLLFDDDDLAAFFAAYGRVDPRTKERARYRAVYHATLEADYGKAVGDGDLRRVGLAALARIAQRLKTP